MNLRKQIAGIFAIAAVTMGMTAGMVAADPVVKTDDAQTPLNVTCSETTEINVDVIGEFEVDITSPAAFYNASLDNGFVVEMDLTCNWSTDFQVDATIGTFEHDGIKPLMPGQTESFPGGHLSWNRLGANPVVYTGPDVHGVTGAPDVAFFAFVFEDESEIIDNNYDILWAWPPVQAIASPGKTTATWNGELLLLPNTLGEGKYVAPLTVTLSVD